MILKGKTKETDKLIQECFANDVSDVPDFELIVSPSLNRFYSLWYSRIELMDIGGTGPITEMSKAFQEIFTDRYFDEYSEYLPEFQDFFKNEFSFDIRDYYKENPHLVL